LPFRQRHWRRARHRPSFGPARAQRPHECQSVTFWTKGNEATASWLNVATGNTDELKCKAQ